MRRIGLLLAALALIAGPAIAAPAAIVITPPITSATSLTTGTLAAARLPSGIQYTIGVASVAIGSGTGDKGTITIPANITKFRINGVSVLNCASTPAGSPLVNLWTAAAGAGTQVAAFSTANLTANTTPATTTNGTASAVGSAVTSTGSVFVNVGTAASSPDTCSFLVSLQDFTGL